MGVLDGEVFIVSSCILSQMLKASVTSLWSSLIIRVMGTIFFKQMLVVSIYCLKRGRNVNSRKSYSKPSKFFQRLNFLILGYTFRNILWIN
jgi:hypothetical protein